MNKTVKILQKPEEFIRSLATDTRRKVLAALRALESGDGDVKVLEGPLQGWYRLRVGRYRIIYREMPGRVLQCVFDEARGVVYDLFEKLLAEKLLDR